MYCPLKSGHGNKGGILMKKNNIRREIKNSKRKPRRIWTNLSIEKIWDI